MFAVKLLSSVFSDSSSVSSIKSPSVTSVVSNRLKVILPHYTALVPRAHNLTVFSYNNFRRRRNSSVSKCPTRRYSVVFQCSEAKLTIWGTRTFTTDINIADKDYTSSEK